MGNSRKSDKNVQKAVHSRWLGKRLRTSIITHFDFGT